MYDPIYPELPALHNFWCESQEVLQAVEALQAKAEAIVGSLPERGMAVGNRSWWTDVEAELVRTVEQLRDISEDAGNGVAFRIQDV